MHWQGYRKDLGNIWMKRLDFRHVANLIMDLRDTQAHRTFYMLGSEYHMAAGGTTRRGAWCIDML
jgi:hypothetical protein